LGSLESVQDRDCIACFSTGSWVFFVCVKLPCKGSNHLIKLVTSNTFPWRHLILSLQWSYSIYKTTLRFLSKPVAWKVPQNLPSGTWQSWISQVAL